MGTQVVVRYEVPPVGLTPAALLARITAVVIPPELFADLGLRIISDVPDIAGTQVRRTWTLGFDPSVNPAVTLVRDSALRIVQVTVTNPGLDLTKPPLITVVDPTRPAQVAGGFSEALFRPFLNVQAGALGTAGVGYSLTPVGTFMGGLPPPPFKPPYGTANNPRACVSAIRILEKGFGYPAGTVVSIQGGGATTQATGVITRTSLGQITAVTLTNMGAGYLEDPQVTFFPPAGFAFPPTYKPAKAIPVMASGTPATGTVTTNGAGAVTGIVMVTLGSGYVSPPNILILDPTGTGAVLNARMGLERVDIINNGRGYTGALTALITPWFRVMFPDGPAANPNGSQPSAFVRYLEWEIARQAVTPIFSNNPVVT